MKLSLEVIERTRFLYGKLQRGKLRKNVGGVTIFNLCMSPGHALYFYTVLCEIISNGIEVIEGT